MKRYLALAIISVALCSCAPEHSKSTGFMTYEADPGYTFVDPNAFFLKTKWTPGIAHPTIQHIVSTQDEGQWIPQSGYDWDDNKVNQPYTELASSDLKTVHWLPGEKHHDYPHISAYSKEGLWTPDAGYAFVSKEGLEVQWESGLPDPARAHYISSKIEGTWELEPGYKEEPGLFGGTYVEWVSGMSYPTDVCLISSTIEGKWIPISGHHLTQQSDGTLEIVADSSEPDWGTVAVKALFAMVSYAASEPQKDDGPLTSAGRHVAGEAGNMATESAIKDVISPNGDDQCDKHVLPANWNKFQD